MLGSTADDRGESDELTFPTSRHRVGSGQALDRQMRGERAFDDAFEHCWGQEGETNNSNNIGCRQSFAPGEILDGLRGIGLEFSPPVAALNDRLDERPVDSGGGGTAIPLNQPHDMAVPL